MLWVVRLVSSRVRTHQGAQDVDLALPLVLAHEAQLPRQPLLAVLLRVIAVKARVVTQLALVEGRRLVLLVCAAQDGQSGRGAASQNRGCDWHPVASS